MSDTHSWWDDRYVQYFEECDEIWHAGDIGSLDVAMRLQKLCPLRAVCGNCDGGDLRRLFPEVLRWDCEGADVLMTHIGGYPGHYDLSIRQQLSTSTLVPQACRAGNRFAHSSASLPTRANSVTWRSSRFHDKGIYQIHNILADMMAVKTSPYSTRNQGLCRSSLLYFRGSSVPA